ncbi:MAG: NADH-quinone oxidoreductase subunit L [Dethiosulfovibrio peptidovorans]|nr:MAG: NADH-quinone oxidoreductase subunit L [Dethiosulfovibrio peptidovorans]
MEVFIERPKILRSPQEIAEHFQTTFGEAITDLELRELSHGPSGEVTGYHLWFTVVRDRFLDVVDEIGTFDFPHFHVTSGDDQGDEVLLYYHLDLYRALSRGTRLPLTVCVRLSKEDLSIPSLFSRIPGVEYSEREIQEMFGVDHVGLPNKALVFLPEDWNREVFPWRRDETAPGDDLVEELS